jgi:hypothetical protein
MGTAHCGLPDRTVRARPGLLRGRDFVVSAGLENGGRAHASQHASCCHEQPPKQGTTLMSVVESAGHALPQRNNAEPLTWVALLLLCSAYIEGGLPKLLDFPAATAELAHFGLHLAGLHGDPWRGACVSTGAELAALACPDLGGPRGIGRLRCRHAGPRSGAEASGVIHRHCRL